MDAWLRRNRRCMGGRTAMTVRAENTRPSQKRGVLAGAGLCSLSFCHHSRSTPTSSRPAQQASPVSLSRRRALHREANQRGHQGHASSPNHQINCTNKNCEKESLYLAKKERVVIQSKASVVSDGPSRRNLGIPKPVSQAKTKKTTFVNGPRLLCGYIHKSFHN